MSHVCPAANRIGQPTVFCPTSGVCPVCRGFVCPEHGCQADRKHVPISPQPVKEPSHAA